jgi:L-amino acid N-acyltransferase YncA
VTIRAATLDDLPAIVAIYNAAIPARASTADLVPVPVDARRPWFDRHAPGRLLVLVDDAGVQAWAGVLPHHERAAYAGTGEVAVYVDPAARGRGAGGRLLDDVIARAPTWGLRVLLGRIFAHNEASLALFAGRGFARWGLLPGVCVLDGVERDVVIVGRRVDRPT